MILRFTCQKTKRIKASRRLIHVNSNQTCQSSKLRQVLKKGTINLKCQTCKTLMRKLRLALLIQCLNLNQSFKWKTNFKKKSKKRLKLRREMMIPRRWVQELGEIKSSQSRINRKTSKRFTLKASIHSLLIREAAHTLRRTDHQIPLWESAWTKIMVFHCMTESATSPKGQAISAISRRRAVFWRSQLPNNWTQARGGKKINFSNQNPQEANLTTRM